MIPNDGRRATNATRRLVLVCLAVFLLASVVRLSFVNEVYRQWRALPADSAALREISFFNPDSPSYLIPARAGTQGQIQRLGSIARPPGYPVFLAMAGTRYRVILGAQALLGACIAVGAIIIVHGLTGSLFLAGFAGTVAAFSPTGIGTTGIIMADLLFAFVMTAGIGLLATATRRGSRMLLYCAGLVFGAAALIKPLLLLWAPVSVILTWLLAGGTLRSFGWRAMTILAALQVAPLALWSVRNLVVDGVFTVSSTGTITMRTYLMSRSEALVALGRSPTREEMRAVRSVAIERGRQQPTIAHRLSLFREESRAIASNYPAQTLQAYATNTIENLTGGWSWFGPQLPRGGFMRDRLLQMARWEAVGRSIAVVLLMAALLLTLWRWRSTRALEQRRRFLEVCGMLMVWAYFVGVGGMTYWHGSRHMYPTSVAVLAAVALGVSSLLPARSGVRVSRGLA